MIAPSPTLAVLGLIFISFTVGFVSIWYPHKLLRYGVSSFLFVAIALTGMSLYPIGGQILSIGNLLPFGLALSIYAGITTSKQYGLFTSIISQVRNRKIIQISSCQVCGAETLPTHLHRCTACGRRYCYPPKYRKLPIGYLYLLGMFAFAGLVFYSQVGVGLVFGFLLMLAVGLIGFTYFHPSKADQQPIRLCGTENLCDRCENSGGLPVYDDDDDTGSDGEEPDWDMDWDEVFENISTGDGHWIKKEDGESKRR